MALRVVTLERKLLAIEAEIAEARPGRHDAGSGAEEHYEVLKSIAEDIRARMGLPHSNVLGQLERALQRMQQSKTSVGYAEGKMVAVANVVVNKWPHISMALKRFGEESCE